MFNFDKRQSLIKRKQLVSIALVCLISLAPLVTRACDWNTEETHAYKQVGMIATSV